jgi:hypothetical protein
VRNATNDVVRDGPHWGHTGALDKVKSTAAAHHIRMPASAGDEGQGEQEHANALAATLCECGQHAHTFQQGARPRWRNHNEQGQLSTGTSSRSSSKWQRQQQQQQQQPQQQKQKQKRVARAEAEAVDDTDKAAEEPISDSAPTWTGVACEQAEQKAAEQPWGQKERSYVGSPIQVRPRPCPRCTSGAGVAPLPSSGTTVQASQRHDPDQV